MAIKVVSEDSWSVGGPKRESVADCAGDMPYVVELLAAVDRRDEQLRELHLKLAKAEINRDQSRLRDALRRLLSADEQAWAAVSEDVELVETDAEAAVLDQAQDELIAAVACSRTRTMDDGWSKAGAQRRAFVATGEDYQGYCLEAIDRRDQVITTMRGAIVHVLRQVQTNPDVRWVIGPGTESFRRLCEAYAAAQGVPQEEAEKVASLDLQPEHRRRRAEVLELRDELHRLKMEHGL